MKKMKFNLNEDELRECCISTARMENNEGKYKYERILRFPKRNEAVLLKEALKVIKALKNGESSIPFYIRTYIHKGGGVYEKYATREIEDRATKLYFGCQGISKILLKQIKLK